jgi:glycine/D-amino acid oxidase-like deaminating enzyme
MEEPTQDYEFTSFNHLISRGYKPERLDTDEIVMRFPAFRPGRYIDGFFNERGGYAESGRVISMLKQKAIDLGIEVVEGIEVARLIFNNSKVTHIESTKNVRIPVGNCIVATGAATGSIVPEMDDYLISTGHPVYHMKPGQAVDFNSDVFPVFAADISNSGWYGFPFHAKAGVVKIANHGIGMEIDPVRESRALQPRDIDTFKDFAKASLPQLANAPIVYTRRCLYSDTRDGHFWIDVHPGYHNLTIAAGGSGHAFKMAPMLGKWICAAAEGRTDDVPERFRWRQFVQNTTNVEEARSSL